MDSWRCRGVSWTSGNALIFVLSVDISIPQRDSAWRVVTSRFTVQQSAERRNVADLAPTAFCDATIGIHVRRRDAAGLWSSISSTQRLVAPMDYEVDAHATGDAKECISGTGVRQEHKRLLPRLTLRWTTCDQSSSELYCRLLSHPDKSHLLLPLYQRGEHTERDRERECVDVDVYEY
ncbi:hypothetical protein K505DRAFT_341601 [Melanomma pulvis-pyrius CBS 109.77]|uniref:Uncharacterized protein n=1 Tax=Melanomma pulvis-pyrius CBS 109.77 TaxID=1314802 RepID=A0A6A6WY57_9PLEO|nr:hypothetical protein K505DRAFT_341601 [Melanomma pulvis-pyrius CBS 109.77]